MTRKKPTKPPEGPATHTARAIAALAPDHARALDQLAEIAAARRIGLERHRPAPGDPDAARHQARLDAAIRLAERVAAARGRTSHRPPSPDPEAWTLSGTIYRRDGEPAPGLTVRVAADVGESAPVTATTDKAGHFAVRLPWPAGAAGDARVTGRLELVAAGGELLMTRPIARIQRGRVAVIELVAGP